MSQRREHAARSALPPQFGDPGREEVKGRKEEREGEQTNTEKEEQRREGEGRADRLHPFFISFAECFQKLELRFEAAVFVFLFKGDLGFFFELFFPVFSLRKERSGRVQSRATERRGTDRGDVGEAGPP